MKVLSVAIPSYNSQDYMAKCIESLLPGGEDVEILVIDDGSKDNTAAIADEYQAKYPGIVRAIHQPNKGHGGAVNTGIENATGVYFKVVDSDDKVDPAAYKQILNTLKEFLHSGDLADMLISNFIYDKEGATRKKVMRYAGVLPEGKMFTWNDVGYFRKGQYMLMHSVIYRTALLRDCGVKLPEHTFYVDNIYVYVPMVHVKKMYYLNVNFYLYYIGREDQSVNEKVMIGRIDQQIRVNKFMLDNVRLDKVPNRRQRQYLFNYLEIITMVSSILLIRSGTEENLAKKTELWQYIQNGYPSLYRKMRWGAMGQMMNLPGKSGRAISSKAYQIAQKLIGFN